MSLQRDASRHQHIVAGNKNWATLVAGINGDYLVAREWALASGRPFTEAELNGAKVAMIGASIVEQLFDNGVGTGETIRIGNVPFSVVAVLDTKG
jgi:putative ABC transport system permease protein